MIYEKTINNKDIKLNYTDPNKPIATVNGDLFDTGHFSDFMNGAKYGGITILDTKIGENRFNYHELKQLYDWVIEVENIKTAKLELYKKPIIPRDAFRTQIKP